MQAVDLKSGHMVKEGRTQSPIQISNDKNNEFFKLLTSENDKIGIKLKNNNPHINIEKQIVKIIKNNNENQNILKILKESNALDGEKEVLANNVDREKKINKNPGHEKSIFDVLSKNNQEDSENISNKKVRKNFFIENNMEKISENDKGPVKIENLKNNIDGYEKKDVHNKSIKYIIDSSGPLEIKSELIKQGQSNKDKWIPSIDKNNIILNKNNELFNSSKVTNNKTQENNNIINLSMEKKEVKIPFSSSSYKSIDKDKNNIIKMRPFNNKGKLYLQSKKTLGNTDDIIHLNNSDTHLPKITRLQSEDSSPQKIFDLGQINVTRPSEIIDQITEYIRKSQIHNNNELKIIVNDQKFGQFKVNVSKHNNHNEIAINIITDGPASQDFFTQHEGSLLKNLTEAGLSIKDLKITQGFDIFKGESSSKSFDFLNEKNSENENLSKFNSNEQGKRDSQKREKLWKYFKERNAA